MVPAAQPDVVVGVSGSTYHAADGGLDALQRRYYDLVERFGGLAPAIVAIASMLDVPAASGAFEAPRPDVVRLLLEASERLKSPLPATAVLALLDDRAPRHYDAISATERIAEICHEANRAYCRTLGDFSQPAWWLAPEWQRKSAIDGVTAILEGRVKSPEESHCSWLLAKEADGWVWGPVKDPEKKQHPCMVSYADLPAEQRAKDALFFAIVSALR